MNSLLLRNQGKRSCNLLGPVKMASGDNMLPMDKMATVMTRLLSKEVYIRLYIILFYFIFYSLHLKKVVVTSQESDT